MRPEVAVVVPARRKGPETVPRLSPTVDAPVPFRVLVVVVVRVPNEPRERGLTPLAVRRLAVSRVVVPSVRVLRVVVVRVPLRPALQVRRRFMAASLRTVRVEPVLSTLRTDGTRRIVGPV